MWVRSVAVAMATLLGVSCGTRIDERDSGSRSTGRTDSAVTSENPRDIDASEIQGAPLAESPSAEPPLGASKQGSLGGPVSNDTAGQESSRVPENGPGLPASGPASLNRSPSAPEGASKTDESIGTSIVPTPGGPKKGSPIIVGSVGTFSGPVGATLAPVVQGAQVWVKFINHKGGLNGHLVQLITYDDGGDTARHRSQVQQAVERDGVIAFLSNIEGASGEPSQEYITAKRIPVIGSEGSADYFYNSPMYFPQAPHGSANFSGAVNSAAQQLIPSGIKKLATLACVELQVCADADRIWAEESGQLGFEHVYRGRAGLAQPDFTAECLAMRNAGAEIILVGLDPASIGRLSLSCARQGYKPRYGSFASILTDQMKEDPNLDGMVGATNVFPYFQSGTPATDEFQRAMRDFGRNVASGVGPAQGWVSGKLFEKAAAAMPEPPNSEALLDALWRFRGDDLGGLTQPLTFHPNEPAQPLVCWFQVTIKDGSWMSPDGFRRHCL